MAEYIEREALLAEFSKCTIIPEDLYDYGIMGGIDAGKKKVKDAPAADVAPVVHGKWLTEIDYDEFWGDLEYYKCSVCGKVELTDSGTPYCPNCGARMIEEDK